MIDEPWRPLHARRRAVGEAALDLGRVPAGRDTLIERSSRHADRACVLGKLGRGQRPLILEQHVMHVPVFALLAGAVRGRGRCAGIGVQLIEREVAEHVTQLARVDVVFLEGRERRREEASAKRALEVGELDEGDRRVGAPQTRCVGHARPHRPTRRATAVGRTLAQQAEHLRELALDRLQICFGACQVGLDRREIPRRVRRLLRPGRGRQGEEH